MHVLGSSAWSAYSKSAAIQQASEEAAASRSKYPYSSAYGQYNRIRNQQVNSLITSPIITKNSELPSNQMRDHSPMLSSKHHHSISPNVQVKPHPGGQNLVPRHVIVNASKNSAAVLAKSKASKCSVIVQKPPMPQLIHKDQISTSSQSKKTTTNKSPTELNSKGKHSPSGCHRQLSETNSKGTEKMEDEILEPLDLSLSSKRNKKLECNDDDVLCLDDQIDGVDLSERPRRSYIECAKPSNTPEKQSRSPSNTSPALSPVSNVTKDTRLASIDDVIRNALASADISNLINPVNFEKHWMRAKQRLKHENVISSSCLSEMETHSLRDHVLEAVESETYHSRNDRQKSISSGSDDSSPSRLSKHVPAAVPCHVLNIAPEIELQDDSMHRMNLVEVKRVPNIHQFGWPRYKNKSKQNGAHVISSNNPDVPRSNEANNSRRPFSIIKFKTDKAMRTDTMAESMLVWTADATQPYFVKPVAAPAATLIKNGGTEAEDPNSSIIKPSSSINGSIINGTNNNKSKNIHKKEIHKTKSVNNNSNNSDDSNSDKVKSTSELDSAPVSSPKSSEEDDVDVCDDPETTSPDIDDDNKNTSNNDDVTDDIIDSGVVSQSSPEEPNEVQEKEAADEMTENPNCEVSDSATSKTQQSNCIALGRELVSPQSSSFEFQDDEATQTPETSNLEKLTKEKLVTKEKQTTDTRSPELQKRLPSPSQLRFTTKSDAKKKNWVAKSTANYQNFFHKLKPEKSTMKKKYQKSNSKLKCQFTPYLRFKLF